jgi:hypothetical protein
LKVKLLDLEFTTEHFYLQQKSIVERITFNNRTFYSKFEQQEGDITPEILELHQNSDVSLAIPLIKPNNCIDYIVIEYQQEDWKAFYSLLKHLLKSLHSEKPLAYYNDNKEIFQLFIPQTNVNLEVAYQEVENIKHHLELKYKKSYKIYPNKNLPKNFNIITLPTQKV